MCRKAGIGAVLALLVLIQGCAVDSPMLELGQGVVKVAESMARGKSALTRDLSQAQGDRPAVSTRHVSPGNPGNLYGGYVRSGNARYLVMLTLQEGRFSHATYPGLQCATNLRAMFGSSRRVQAFEEFVYYDTNGQCSASDRVELREGERGGYYLRTYSGGRITGEGLLSPMVVPVPDSMVGAWKSVDGYSRLGGELQVVFAQDGLSYTDFDLARCKARSLMSYQDSGRLLVAGYQEPTQCDNGGYVVFEMVRQNLLQRTTYAPNGETTSQVMLSRALDR
jgi:hypothetical protein